MDYLERGRVGDREIDGVDIHTMTMPFQIVEIRLLNLKIV